MKPLRRLLVYFARYRVRALAALLAMGIVSFSTVAMLFLFGKVVDDALGAGTAASLSGLRGPGAKTAPLLRWFDTGYAAARRAAETNGVDLRAAVVLLLLLALISKNVLSYFSEFELNTIGVSIVRDLRRDTYRKLLRQSSRFYSKASTGDLISRMLSDVEQIQTAFGNNLTDLVQGVLTLLLVVAYVFSLNARLAMIAFSLAPFVLLPIVYNARRLGRAATAARERIGEMGSLLSETLRGHRVIKTYGMEEFEAKRFEEANERYFRVTRRTVRLQALTSPLIEILAGIGFSALFIYAAAQIHARRMNVGDLFSFLAALMMMYKPLRDVTRINMAVQVALSAARRVFDLMDREIEGTDRADALSLAPFSEAIRYENVAFAYGDETVLRDVTLTIRRGETVAIVGPSGSGKTTLVNLLPRLYDPTNGRITLDGIDLRDATLASLRGQMSLVTQETVVFDSTARENIAYGQSAPPEARVRAAARAAYAAEFLERLPLGYETRLLENGDRLSGGQKQRLAIARALYKDAPILILDEATSQLDAESEAVIARACANLMKDRTTLVIAHRLSTVRRADRIVVLDRGRIVESGTHRELLNRQGLYRRLHDMQYFTELDAPTAAPAVRR